MAGSLNDRMKEAAERHEKLKYLRSKKMEEIDRRSEERIKESERISQRVKKVLAEAEQAEKEWEKWWK